VIKFSPANKVQGEAKRKESGKTEPDQNISGISYNKSANSICFNINKMDWWHKTGYITFGYSNFHEEVSQYFNCKVNKRIDFLVPRGDLACAKHSKDNWSLITFDCLDCCFVDHCEYIVSHKLENAMYMFFDKNCYRKHINLDTVNLASLNHISNKTRYMEAFEHQLHMKYIRYRIRHHHCSKDIDYTGLDIRPVVDRCDFKIFTSPSGYKIFLCKTNIDFPLLETWIADHPIVVHQDTCYPILDGMECEMDVLDEIRRNMQLLRSEVILRKLIYLYQTGIRGQIVGFIKIANYLQHKIKTDSKGIIISGAPGVGKTHDLTASMTDAYWLPYDYKTKNYYDGYTGETTLVIDDLGHFSKDEWKILIRLVNEAPWTFPMARAENKDLISNVSQSVVVTTNNLDKLMKLPKCTRDAICRRFECYEYENDLVVYKRYSYQHGKYESVYVMTREEFRLRLQLMSIPIEFQVSTKYQSSIFTVLGNIFCDIMRFFRLPSFRRTITNITDKIQLYLPIQYKKIGKILEIVDGGIFDLFEWSRLVTDQKRSLRYLTSMTGYPFKEGNYHGVTDITQAVARSEGLCGSLFNLTMDQIYDKNPIERDVEIPACVRPAVNFDDIPMFVHKQYSEIGTPLINREKQKIPKHHIKLHGYQYTMKDNLPYEYGLLDKQYNTIDHPFCENSPKFKDEYLIIRDESEYKPNNPISSRLNKKKVNEFLHPKTRSKTRKRREQRKRNQ
jgi:hypothetical protein